MRVYGKLYRQEHPRLLIGVRKADGHVGDSARHTVRQPRGRYDVATRSPDKEHLDWRSIAYRAQADYYRFVGHIDRSLVPIPDGILLAYGMLLYVRLDFYGQYVVYADAKVVLSV